MTGLVGITNGPHCRLYQWGYAVSSMKTAAAIFSKNMGVPEFRITENMEGRDNEGKPFTFHIGNGFVNDLAIELVQPVGGADHLFRDGLSGREDEIRLHHMGYIVPTPENWDALRREIDKRALPIARENVHPHFLQVVFVDTRNILGFYLEFVHIFPEGQRRYDEIVGRAH